VNKPCNRLTIRSFSIGFSAAVLALACGAEDSNNGKTTPLDIPREDPCANPLNAGCGNDPEPIPVIDTSGPGAGPNTGNTPEPRSQGDLDKAAAENVLASKCGFCHGPALTQQQAQAGMNYIDDIDQLVATGKILPRNSAGSPLVQKMVRGLMPPPGSGYPLPTAADIDIVVSYIDNPRYWEGVADSNCRDDEQLVTFDQLYEAINRDLSGVDDDDQQFVRYISLTNRFTAGVCSGALDRDRQAVVKMMNMLSIAGPIGDVTPANQDNTLYRIDLRDFDWNRQITVENENFNDVWEAIARFNPYAVEFVGDDVDDAKEDMLTDFPVMFADQMMDVAVLGNLYYAIVDIDVTQTLTTFVTDQLDIDLQADIDNDDAIRAGTTKSIVSRQDRVVERHDIGNRGGAFWLSFDFENDANESIFEDPFGFAAGGSEAIFTLPNGMLAYIIADANDNIVETSNILLDRSQEDFLAVTAVSCSNCHATGFIPVIDEVGPVAERNARQLQLDNDEVEQLRSLYVSPAAFAKQIKEDSETFYQRALQAAALPLVGGDPVASVFLRFDDDLRIADAAGDLGLTPEDLQQNLTLLNPVLTILRDSTLDRDDFTARYVESLCILQNSSANAPDEAVCDLLE
jgi:hypothetical protein